MEYQREWRKRNPNKSKQYWNSESNIKHYKEYVQTPEYKEARRGIRYKNRYGITLEDYESLYREQQGLCTICGKPPKPNQRLYVDHDHQTGKVRKLLCQGCNSGIGFFNHNPELLRKGAKYLENNS